MNTHAIVPLRQRAPDRPGPGIGVRGTGIKAAVVDVAYTRVNPRAAGHSAASAERVSTPGRPCTAARRPCRVALREKDLVVRYRTRPEAAEENARLVEAVCASLKAAEPHDLVYATYRLADGVTLVQVARRRDAENPRATLPAFAEFQRGLKQRCVEQPAPSEATVVGSYGWPS